MKDHISNNKLEKGDHYYIKTRHKDLFSHYKLLEKKCPEKCSKIQTKCVHAPWASYNTVSVKRSFGFLLIFSDAFCVYNFVCLFALF